MTKKHNGGRAVLAMVVAMAGMAAAAFAGDDEWIEVGDAGQDGVGAAQLTVGQGPLANIFGTLDGNNDADLYCIRITNEAQFLASVISFPGSAVLSLFNPDGTLQVGSYDPAGDATITSQGVFTNGIYFLGISSFENKGLGADEAPVFADTVWPGPDLAQYQGTGSVLDHWDNQGKFGGTYRIILHGAAFHVPTPGAGAMLGLGGMLMLRRRRRA